MMSNEKIKMTQVTVMPNLMEEDKNTDETMMMFPLDMVIVSSSSLNDPNVFFVTNKSNCSDLFVDNLMGHLLKEECSMGDDIALEIVDEIKHRNASNHFDDNVLNSLMNRSKILMNF